MSTFTPFHTHVGRTESRWVFCDTHVDGWYAHRHYLQMKMDTQQTYVHGGTRFGVLSSFAKNYLVAQWIPPQTCICW